MNEASVEVMNITLNQFQHFKINLAIELMAKPILLNANYEIHIPVKRFYQLDQNAISKNLRTH
jgi:hypothetical protein